MTPLSNIKKLLNKLTHRESGRDEGSQEQTATQRHHRPCHSKSSPAADPPYHSAPPFTALSLPTVCK
ncbi:hypothetical protein LSTR_LSTR010076 [Laodelphax striatellus]|uniref:Uncharacterized protein n=1 Tax=Laodelphax striatellus TaxID=195883 RepID=A0A482XGI8_LAOST|nr:hypothetical protein LSTR_LSTR010076 [Laodelphax striatellus]